MIECHSRVGGRRELRMKKAGKVQMWVVYRMTIHRHPEAMNAVCSQSEWDAMESARPGYHTLVRAGIANEAEAERLARGTSGDAKPRFPQTLAQPKAV
jgi:hypothetical protein